MIKKIAGSNVFLGTTFRTIFMSLMLGNLALAQEDQVVVIEDLSKAELRNEIELIEQELYQMFNSNMENKDFHISCRNIIPTGSNISVRSCEPQFFIEARANNVNDSRLTNQILFTDAQLKSSHTNEFQALTESMEKIAKDNPSFAQLVMILNKLNARLDQINR